MTSSRAHPESPLAWATLAEQAREQGADDLTVYAYARVGYHRSLDLLRRNGWKGHGPVPWEHEPNRGFLRALAALSRAADAIGETHEAERCAQFLRDSSPTAADVLLPRTLTVRLRLPAGQEHLDRALRAAATRAAGAGRRARRPR